MAEQPAAPAGFTAMTDDDPGAPPAPAPPAPPEPRAPPASRVQRLRESLAKRRSSYLARAAKSFVRGGAEAGGEAPATPLAEPLVLDQMSERARRGSAEDQALESEADVWRAAAEGEEAELRRLLDAGYSPNIAKWDGSTPLHLAARAGAADCVDTLLLRGVAVDARAKGARTALHWACLHGRGDAAKRLLAASADADAVTEDGRTPLHFAAGDGSAACVAALLRAPVGDPSAVDADGRTALHFAAIDGSVECVQMLLDVGVDAALQDRWERTALDLARGGGHDAVAALLPWAPEREFTFAPSAAPAAPAEPEVDHIAHEQRLQQELAALQAQLRAVNHEAELAIGQLESLELERDAALGRVAELQDAPRASFSTPPGTAVAVGGGGGGGGQRGRSGSFS